MTSHHVFQLGQTSLQRGMTLPAAHLAYQTYGTLAPDRSNAILYPTSYGAQHTDIDWLIGANRILDPTRYFIIIPNQFGNGLSTSPSNLAAPFAEGRAPVFTHWDNVQAQKRLVQEHFGIHKLALVYGWSMGGQQALHWGALFPDRVARICALCTSARTSPHNMVFLEGIRAVLTSAPEYRQGAFTQKPVAALRAFGRVYAGWAQSQAFYRQELWRGMGFSSLEDFLVRGWEGNFLRRPAEDLLSMIDTWMQSDISDNPTFNGDLTKALRSIGVPSLIMPGTTDLYFTAEDSAEETRQMPCAELRPIPSVYGHRAGNPAFHAPDETFIRIAVAELLARSA